MKNLEMVIEFGCMDHPFWRTNILFEKMGNLHNFTYYDDLNAKDMKSVVMRELFSTLYVSSEMELNLCIKDVCLQMKQLVESIGLRLTFYSFVTSDQLKYLCYTCDIKSIKSS